MADNELIGFIRSAIKGQLSANRALEDLRATGHGIRRADFLDLYRQMRDDMIAQTGAVDRPGDRRPYSREIFVMTTVIETGFMQHIDIWVKDRETGEIRPRPFSIRTDDLMTHDDAIATGLEQFSAHADFYGETILGATYRSTYVLVPKGK